MSKPELELTRDAVHIKDAHGDIVMWTRQEWEEDPSVVISIANAIRIAYEDGTECLRTLLKKEDEADAKVIGEILSMGFFLATETPYPVEAYATKIVDARRIRPSADNQKETSS